MLVEFDECGMVSAIDCVPDDSYRLLYISVSPVSGFQKPWVLGTYKQVMSERKGGEREIDVVDR